MKIFSFFCKKILPAAAVVFLACTAAPAQEFSPDRVEKDLEVIEARLVRSPDGQMLIDRGSSHGVQKGDLWSIYPQSGTVKDPETGDNLGEFASRIAVCRVTRPAEKLSAVDIKCLRPDCSVEPGFRAYRNEGITARFIDKTGGFYEHYKSLRLRLQHLDWEGYEKDGSGSPEDSRFSHELVFAADQEGITLWSGTELRAVYSAEGRGRDESEVRKPSPASDKASQAPEFRKIAELDEKVDNIGIARTEDDKTPFLLGFGGRKIRAMDMEGNQIHDYEYKGFGEPVSMSASGGDLLALNVYKPDSGMSSMVLKLTGTGFEKVADNISYALAFMQNPAAEGSPELWGQRFSRSELLLPVVHRLVIEDGSAVKENDITVPRGYSVFSGFYADLNGNGIREKGFFSPGGKLVVRESQDKIWESYEKVSAPAAKLLVNDPDYQEAAPDRLDIWSQPAVFRYNEATCAAVSMNSTGLIQAVTGGSGKAGVGVFCPSGSSYRLERLDGDFQGEIKDVCVYEDRLLVCAEQSGFSGSQEGCSIFSMPLSGAAAGMGG
ncbi:MAG: hypothetical protein R6U97_09940 [Desulfosalsimonas sp.]